MNNRCYSKVFNNDKFLVINKMMKYDWKVKNIGLLLLMICFCLTSWSQPTSIVVTSTANDGIGSLRQAISNVADGGTITFDSTEFATKQTITLNSTLIISKNMTIDGAGMVILNGGNSGNGATDGVRIMSVLGNVTLCNITFENGYSNEGGAAIKKKNAKLIIENSAFKGNYSGGDGNGGAIFNDRGTLVISNSVFANNSAKTSGGAINNTLGTLIVLNSTFTGNSIAHTKRYGGAIWSASGNAYILNSIVVGNSFAGGIDDISCDNSNKSSMINVVEGEVSGKTVDDIFESVEGGKAVLGDDGRIEIKEDGPARRMGIFIWKNADYTTIAFSYSRLAAAREAFFGTDETLANMLIETDITGINRQFADIGACSKIIRGTEAYYPLYIDSIDDLQTLRDSINTGVNFTYKGFPVPAGGENTYFKLTADLDLSSVCGANIDSVSWVPIGNNSNQFKGHFHGGGYTISNLYINAPSSDFQGLFGNMESGSIDSLNLVNTNITAKNYVGGLCADVTNSTISYCTNSGIVCAIENYVGGLCGFNESNSLINNCVNSGSISGNQVVGGVAGLNQSNSEINNCVNIGSVCGFRAVGGVCGENYISTICYCVNSSSVSGNQAIGVVVGNDNNSEIINCYYDKQMCAIGGINGNDVAGQAEGKLTTEMIGTSLQQALGTVNWTFNEVMYPRPNGIENTDAAIVAATPIFLANSETVADVKSDFSVGELVGAIWSASPERSLQFEGTEAIIESNGEVEVTVTKNTASKTIKLMLNKSLGIKNLKKTENDIKLENTTDGFFVDCGTESTIVILYAIDGKQLKVYTISGRTYFDLSCYDSGIYLVRVNNRVFKVVK